jgi:hypothetical protein
MTTYRKLHGRAIQAVTTDPTESVAEGQVWYNTNSDTFKSIISSEAFSSGAAMGTGRYNFAGWAGSAPADTATCFGGMTAAPAISNLTEEFNGSGWTAGGNTNTARRQGAGFGIQTAAVKTAGYDGSSPSNDNTSEEYNGTAWTTGNNVNPQRQGHAGAGTLTAGVIFGGTDGTLLNKTEEYDGTNFSNVNNMNTARQNLSGAGSQTTSLAFGGSVPSASNATEVYDGTNWTTAGNMNTARFAMGSFGDSSSAVGTGGSTGSNSSVTETWDGTSWTTSPASLTSARQFFGDTGSGGSSTNGIVAGGYTTATVGITEEYNKSINFITSAAWSSGGTLNQTRSSLSGSSGAGTETAGVITTGNLTSTTVSSNTEEYDGTSWTEVTNYPTGTQWLTGVGTQTAGLFFGGQQGTNSSGGPNTTLTTEYDGSSFSTGGALGTARRILGACGTQTAAIASNGSPRTNASQEYDGSSWTTTPSTNATAEGRGSASSASSTAALVFGGSDPSPGKEVEEYNGSSWSEQNNLIDDRRYLSGFGTQTNALGCAGYDQEATTNLGTCVRYDGTSWSTDQSLSGVTRSQYGALSGAPATGGVITGGYSTTRLNITEEYNAETSTLNVKTLTQS